MITIFTPTYNRGYILGRLYSSLCKQSYKDFEWLIVDDGSTDNTEKLIRKFIEDNRIIIRYFKVKNGGKHRAINYGVKYAHGELFFIVDSDDFLVDYALERVMFHYISIKDSDEFAGICGLRIYPDGKVMGNGKNYTGIIDCNRLELAFKYYFTGDVAEVFKTDVLCQYPFPDYEGETFCSEGLIWNRMALKYKLRVFFEGIYVCDYLNDGLTLNKVKLFRNNPQYTMLVHCDAVRCKLIPFRWKIRYAINYWRFTWYYKGKRSKEQCLPLWANVCYPLGMLVYFLDDLRIK